MSTQFPSNSPQLLVGVQVKTADYNVVLADHAQLLVMNSAGAHTFTLPATPPTRNGWFVYFQNIGAGTCTIARNGNNIDGAATNVTLTQGTGILVASDGSTYYTERGVSIAPPVTSVFGRTGVVTAQSGDYSVGQVTGAEATANKDTANGYAGLDANVRLKLAEQTTAVDARTTTSEAIVDSDRAKIVTFSNAAAVAATIAQAGTGGNFASGWYCDLVNLGVGDVTLTPTTSTINGLSALVLKKGEGVRLASDGANYVFIAGQPTTDSPNDADILTYVAADGRWEAKPISALGGANASQLRGKNISSATPADQDILRWSSTDNAYDLVLTDGLYHGDSIFGVDASLQRWFDDFVFGFGAADASGTSNVNTSSDSGIGELRWDIFRGAGVGTAINRAVPSIPPHVGAVNFLSGTSASSFSSLFWRGGAGTNTGGGSGNIKQSGGMPLFDYPAWKIVWVFGFPSQRQTTTATPFPLTKKSFYCGLAPHDGSNVQGGIPTWSPANGSSARPPWFAGLRFDTDPGSGALALTSVANASGGKTVYTGTGLTLTVNAWIGTLFTIAGFTNGANNGTFLCTANSATTLTLVNASGVAETHAATATGPALSDSTFQFEVVSNANCAIRRINNQGTVSSTGITPTENAWYRFEMTYTAAGNLIMTLSGNGSTATHTFSSVPTTTCKGANTTHRGNGLGDLQPGANVTDASSSNHAWAIGSIVTMSGMGQTFYNGTFTLLSQDGSGSWVYILAGAADTTANATPTVTGYPGVVPYFAWGNDTQSTPATANIALDLFAMVWNTGLASSPATLDTTRSRYLPNS